MKKIDAMRKQIEEYQDWLAIAGQLAKETVNPELFYALDDRLTRGETAVILARQSLTRLEVAANG